MLSRVSRFFGLAGVVTLCCLGTQPVTSSQEPQLPGTQVPAPLPVGPAAPQEPGAPAGVEVLARGPVHEAFATPTSEPKPTPLVGKKPPAPLDEMPPEERPEGDVVWIGGYWAWDDDRQDFLWVSGCWRAKPDGKEWVPGYWRETAGHWQWAPGFWSTSTQGRPQDVTYYPEPPAPPPVALPPEPPNVDMIYVPGHWHWAGSRYVWQAGYWTRARPGFVYVPAHYRWTPFGYVFVAGYWDLAVPRRGVLYAPVVVQTAVVGPRFVYTPYYAVSDVIVLDALFIHPGRCHYYFGDYYGPRYRTLGFETCVVYSRRHHEPLIVYQRWEHRNNPRWLDVQISLVVARDAGRAPVPPRTLVQQKTIVQNVTNVTINKTTVNNVTINNNVSNTTVLAPTKNVVAARGAKAVAVDPAARLQAKEAVKGVQQAVVLERQKTETSAKLSPKDMSKPRVASFNVPSMPTTALPTGGPGGSGQTPGADTLFGKPSLGSTVKPPGQIANPPGKQPLVDPAKGVNKGPFGKPLPDIKKFETPKVTPPSVQPPSVQPPTGQAPKPQPPKVQPPSVAPPTVTPPKVQPPSVTPIPMSDPGTLKKDGPRPKGPVPMNRPKDGKKGDKKG